MFIQYQCISVMMVNFTQQGVLKTTDTLNHKVPSLRHSDLMQMGLCQWTRSIESSLGEPVLRTIVIGRVIWSKEETLWQAGWAHLDTQGWTQVKSESVSHTVMSYSLRLQGLLPARLLCPWDSPGENIGVDCHFLLLGIFPVQGSNRSSCSSSTAGRFFTVWATKEAQTQVEPFWLEGGLWALPGCPPRELLQNLCPWTGMWAQQSEISYLDSRSKHLLDSAPDAFSDFLAPAVLWKTSPLVNPTLPLCPLLIWIDKFRIHVEQNLFSVCEASTPAKTKWAESSYGSS